MIVSITTNSAGFDCRRLVTALASPRATAGVSRNWFQAAKPIGSENPLTLAVRKRP